MYYNQGTYNISDSIKRGLIERFKNGSALSIFIYINIGLFFLIKLLGVFMFLGGVENYRYVILTWIGVPAMFEGLLRTPWTLFTYMFTQFDFFHLLFNMLWLYWFGTMFLNYFDGKQLTGVYILGGISGALLYMCCYSLLPAFAFEKYLSFAIGASASVMAIVFAVCTYLPNHNIYIFLIGPVKLIYLALFTAFIDLISIQSGNAGGHIAHIGGALFGYFFTLGIRRNFDITKIFNIFNKSGKSKRSRKMKVKYKKNVSDMTDREYNETKKNRDIRINDILDKISKSGYESLTKDEKEILFKSGKN